MKANFIEGPFFEILGISVVSVTRGAGLGHVYSYMSECKKSLVLLNCLPCRLSSVYFIDPPLVTEVKSKWTLQKYSTVVKQIIGSQIIKPIILLYTTFMSMKMQARMQYYNEWSELIPKKVSERCGCWESKFADACSISTG